MTKEEIREGVAKNLAQAHGFIWHELSEESIHKKFYRELSKSMAIYEDSQGVVIISDKEVLTRDELIMYGTVEPLI